MKRQSASIRRAKGESEFAPVNEDLDFGMITGIMVRMPEVGREQVDATTAGFCEWSVELRVVCA